MILRVSKSIDLRLREQRYGLNCLRSQMCEYGLITLVWERSSWPILRICPSSTPRGPWALGSLVHPADAGGTGSQSCMPHRKSWKGRRLSGIVNQNKLKGKLYQEYSAEGELFTKLFIKICRILKKSSGSNLASPSHYVLTFANLILTSVALLLLLGRSLRRSLGWGLHYISYRPRRPPTQRNPSWTIRAVRGRRSLGSDPG